MHVENRRNYLALRYYYKVKGHLDNPANKYLILLSYRTLFLNKNISLPLSLRVQSLLETYKLRKNFIKPQFSYKILEIAQTTWALKPPDINFQLARYSKLSTPHTVFG